MNTMKPFDTFTNKEKKYCGCVMKVRGQNYKKTKKIINPYGICTAAFYNKSGNIRNKVVKCSQIYNYDKYPKSYLQAYCLEKNLPIVDKQGKKLVKNQLLKNIQNKLDSLYKSPKKTLKNKKM